ncbi:nucleotide 5'-monophosphate nucleosidase PpnN [Microbulbifer agarilyticus]|uniref:nucleotide 5'-monophosphate nucleosidase PpnN n=1 Tax=Microbulbifer agarilyticus TaxID=260552 RepID=UPI001CD6309E|nr:nucleotide 5'-monophosphate nucleosidase PpnN [Microbulbifer agarilyticus]MCA0901222.1 nucleotide 5'-monophosphate nucleosidase PpnN [Microbulbifer agarilyticus]
MTTELIDLVDARVSPTGQFDILSKYEIHKLTDTSRGPENLIFRNCALAVLNCGNYQDDGKELLEQYADFSISVIPTERSVKLKVCNAPAGAFVDGRMIQGIAEHLFAVLRDIIYVRSEITGDPRYDLVSAQGVTDAVFHILRNAGTFDRARAPRLVVCWGGHSISRAEYDYTKTVGYELALRSLDICTGCGPGAMKGPMKGATIGHAKQRDRDGQYLGITEPGIIAAEAPNPIVNQLVIMPDIEKRLEAFVRTGHGIVVFPGGAGTAEEILYLLGILLHEENKDQPFPLIFTGPASAEEYFFQIDQFIGETLGEEARSRYQIIIDDPQEVARQMSAGILKVRQFRKETGDAYYYNWQLKISTEFQRPFTPTHENMRDLALHNHQQPYLLAANLRRAFSGIVSGNVKDEGIRNVEKYGPYELRGDPSLMQSMDTLLNSFVKQQRMKLPGTAYKPCYRISAE